MARRFSFSRFHIDTTGITSHTLRKTQTGKTTHRSQKQTADTLSPSPFLLVISSQLVDHYEGWVDHTAENVTIMDGGTDMLETTDTERLTLELIAYVESLRDPKAPKTVPERHHTVRPQKPYPVHNPLTLADVETSRPFPQPQPRPNWYEWDDWHELSGSKGHLNDRTDVTDAVQDLKVLSANLYTDITQAHRQRHHNTPLQDELLDEWLDQSIATTNALLRQGKTALVSKASEMVGRVLANEKGVGQGKTAVCCGGQMRDVEEESRDITSERRVSSGGRFPVKVGSGGRDS